MGRTPCCDRNDVRRGPWSPDEDATLRNYMRENRGNGGSWIALPARAGLKRCGKSCRLRWMNYLRPEIKRGDFTKEEDEVICALYLSIGSRWSVIASKLPGRTDNDIKNYWNTKLKKKLKAALAPNLCYAPDSDCIPNPLQPDENNRQSSLGKDSSLEMVSVSVAATESDLDNTNNASDLHASSSERFLDNRVLMFRQEEEAFLDFGGNAFFSDFGYLDSNTNNICNSFCNI